jgi:hypothetical protein
VVLRELLGNLMGMAHHSGGSGPRTSRLTAVMSSSAAELNCSITKTLILPSSLG